MKNLQQKLSTLALALVAFAVGLPVQAASLTRYGNLNAKCMDGSPATFYYSANQSDSDTWVVIFGGSNIAAVGGEDVTTVGSALDACFEDDVSGDGSIDDDNYLSDGDQGPDGLCDGVFTTNNSPALVKNGIYDSTGANFGNAQKIWAIGSCTGDGYIGDTDIALARLSWTPLDHIYFNGQDFVNEVIDVLVNSGIDHDNDSSTNKLKIDAGSEVFFGGVSRGTMVPWYHGDAVCDDLTTNVGVEKCLLYSGAILPNIHKPDTNTKGDTSKNWPDFVQMRKDRYTFQGGSHNAACPTVYDSVSVIGTIDSAKYILDTDLTSNSSKSMCYTMYGLVSTLSTPIMMFGNRGDFEPEFGWDYDCGPDHHSANCLHNPEVRDQDLGALVSALPANSALRIADGRQHLILGHGLNASCAGSGTCAEDIVDFQEIGSNVDNSTTYLDSLEEYFDETIEGMTTYCVNNYCE